MCMPLNLPFANVSCSNYRYIKSCKNIILKKLTITYVRQNWVKQKWNITNNLEQLTNNAILFICRVTSKTTLNLKFKYQEYSISTVHSKVVWMDAGLRRLQQKPRNEIAKQQQLCIVNYSKIINKSFKTRFCHLRIVLPFTTSSWKLEPRIQSIEGQQRH